MPFAIGTFESTWGGTNFTPFTPYNILPEPGDHITYDWMYAAAQFAQRFNTMVIATVTVGSGASTSFDYSSLRCIDNFPILDADVYLGTTLGWSKLSYYVNHPYGNDNDQREFAYFGNIGSTQAYFYNRSAKTIFLLKAYL